MSRVLARRGHILRNLRHTALLFVLAWPNLAFGARYSTYFAVYEIIPYAQQIDVDG